MPRKKKEPPPPYTDLGLFKIAKGASIADPVYPDVEGLEVAKTLMLMRTRRASKIPTAVLDPRIVTNPDDGICRNMYALTCLKETPKETADTRKQVLASANGVCSYCDEEIRSNIICDHVWPAQHGGTHLAINRVAACIGCNMAAGSERTESVLHRRAYVRMKRKLKADNAQSYAKFLLRVQHLHPDLLR